jgi:hypothetical protein
MNDGAHCHIAAFQQIDFLAVQAASRLELTVTAVLALLVARLLHRSGAA